MIARIFDSKNHAHNIFSYTPYSEFLLLKEEYKAKEMEAKMESPKFKQLVFNTLFLETMLRIRGRLICVYCGKENLRIFHWTEKSKNYSIMATADHFIPKSKGGAAFDFKNMVVACNRCNCNKADKIYPVSSLKHIEGYGFKINQFENV